MVLFGASNLTSAYDLFVGPVKIPLTIEAFDKLILGNLNIKLCKVCEEVMASIPPSAFSAGRIRETQRDMKISNINKGTESHKFFNNTATELSPLKYNSKLMNSIWGFYNRYSPHNVKKVNDARAFNGELQQSSVNSPNKNEPIISLPSKLDVWATVKVSQSH